MNIRYRSIPNPDETGAYSVLPLIQICLRHGNRGRVFLALVDSGAAECIFPESMGTLLGIDVPSGKPKKYYGLANQVASGFVHSVDLQVTGIPQSHTISAGFVSSDIVPLLGQTGFFENYQVVFERFRRLFQVITKSDALVRAKLGR